MIIFNKYDDCTPLIEYIIGYDVIYGFHDVINLYFWASKVHLRFPSGAPYLFGETLPLCTILFMTHKLWDIWVILMPPWLCQPRFKILTSINSFHPVFNSWKILYLTHWFSAAWLIGLWRHYMVWRHRFNPLLWRHQRNMSQPTHNTVQNHLWAFLKPQI